MTSVKTTFRWECLPCKKYYSSIQGYDYHLLTHTQSKPYKCKFCSSEYRSSSHTHEHMRQKHLQEYMGHKQKVRASGRKGQGQKSKPKSKSKSAKGRKQDNQQGQSQTGSQSRTSNRTKVTKPTTVTESETVRRFQVQVDSVKIVPCLNCSKTFQDERSLKIHWTKIHEKEIFNKSSARNIFEVELATTSSQKYNNLTNNQNNSSTKISSTSTSSSDELVVVDDSNVTTECSSSSSSFLQHPLSLLSSSNLENVPLPDMESNITKDVNDFSLSTTATALNEINKDLSPTSMSLEPDFDDCLLLNIVCARCGVEFFESRELREHIASSHQDIECIDAFDTTYADDDEDSLRLQSNNSQSQIMSYQQQSSANRKSVIVYAPSWSNSLESISFESSYDSSKNSLELE